MSEGNTECKSRTGEGKKPGTVESEGWKDRWTIATLGRWTERQWKVTSGKWKTMSNKKATEGLVVTFLFLDCI